MAVSFNGQDLFCASCASIDLIFFKDGIFIDLAGSNDETGIVCERCGSMFSKEYAEEHLSDFTSDERRDELIFKRRAKSEHYQKLDAEQEKLEHDAEVSRLARQAKAIEKSKHEAEQKSLWKSVE